MKRLIPAVVFLLMTGSPAIAARNANGSMVVHTNDSVSYSNGTNYCETVVPDDCAQLVTRTNKGEDAAAIIWVMGTWCWNASPGVTGYRFGVTGDIPIDYFWAWAPCGPSPIESPDATWPAPDTGTEVLYGSTVYPAPAMKMYWFAAFGWTGATFGTRPYPHGDMRASFLDDSNPPLIDFCYAFGHVAWGMPGQNSCADCWPPVACCFTDGTCELLPYWLCLESGGDSVGEAVCEPNPCPTSGIAGDPNAAALRLSVYPAPAARETTIHLELPGEGIVRASILDVSGREIRQLHDGALAAGRHDLLWDGCDDAGRHVGPGVFLARVSTAEGVKTARIVVLR